MLPWCLNLPESLMVTPILYRGKYLPYLRNHLQSAAPLLTAVPHAATYSQQHHCWQQYLPQPPATAHYTVVLSSFCHYETLNCICVGLPACKGHSSCGINTNLIVPRCFIGSLYAFHVDQSCSMSDTRCGGSLNYSYYCRFVCSLFIDCVPVSLHVS
jgi:hypothetical protein